jgi:hypothetical protein
VCVCLCACARAPPVPRHCSRRPDSRRVAQTRHRSRTDRSRVHVHPATHVWSVLSARAHTNTTTRTSCRHTNVGSGSGSSTPVRSATPISRPMHANADSASGPRAAGRCVHRVKPVTSRAYAPAASCRDSRRSPHSRWDTARTATARRASARAIRLVREHVTNTPETQSHL